MTASTLLTVDGLGVRFNAFQALDNVSFTIAEGELLALIGPNGAGKTTLLNLLAGEVLPTSGEITLAGKTISGLPPHRIAQRGLARTFQAAEPFQHLTVRENVVAGAVPGASVGLARSLAGPLALRSVTRALNDQADVLLEKVGLRDKADLAAALLTAGQRRLLSIARVLATGANLLVLDEPGAGLNEAEKAFLGDVILALSAEGKTILFVDHDMPLVSRIAGRIMVLDRGRLIADGKPEAVRNDPGVLQAYLGRRNTDDTPAPAPARQTVTPLPVRRPLLEIDRLQVSYGGLVAVDDVSLGVGEGEIVALVGANGAGKSSLLRAIARMEPCRADRMHFGGGDLQALRTDTAVAAGVSLVPEGRALFGSLTVLENLGAGRYANRRAKGFHHILWQAPAERTAFEERLAEVYDLFPLLKERATQLAGTLSGGQGQMLAIGRALMGAPRLLMLDEPSLGLAPQIIDEIFASIEQLRRRGMTILLVEQNIGAALSICDRGFVLANGRIVASGPGRDLLQDPAITQAYLGGASPPDEAAAPHIKALAQ
jgi:branched-chain amino acid transport system ATP-binding protein